MSCSVVLMRWFLKFSVCLLSVAVIVATRVGISNVYAQSSSAPCGGLDVVFLIDQSASMRDNDTESLRGSAVRYAIDLLGDNSVYQCPGAVHRLAVLGFGDRPTPTTYLPPTTISPSFAQLEQWKAEKETLRSEIPNRDYLGGTDHLGGLRAAAQILKTWHSEPVGNGVRRRAVVLITDGGPCVSSKGCTTNPATNKFDTPAYMQEMEKFTDPLGVQFPYKGDSSPESIFLFMIAFRDTASKYDYLKDSKFRAPWERITKSHGGAIVELTADVNNAQRANLGTVVADVMDNLLGSNLSIVNCNEPIWVDPYVSDVAILHFFRRGSNPGVNLDDVTVRIRATHDGNLIAVYENGRVVEGTGGVNEYTRDGPNERYVLYNPPPGKYVVEVEGADICKQLDVRQGKTNARIELVAPKQDAVMPQVDQAPYYDPDAPVHFVFRATQQGLSSERVPLKEDVGFPLSVVVKATNGEDTSDYKLVRKEEGVYESETPITLQNAGTTTWEVIATAPNPRSEANPPITTPIQVFNEKGSFTVKPVQRFSYRIVEPASAQQVSLNTVSGTHLLPIPVDIAIELLDPNGRTADPRTILTGDANKAFVATVLDPQGNELEQVALRPDANRQGLFIGQARATPQGLTGVDPEGEYVLQVKWTGEYDALNYAPKSRTESVKFTRVSVKPLDAAISTPSTLVLHQSGAGCVTGATNTFPITVSFHFAAPQEGNKQVSAAQVLASTQGFEATLYDSQNKTETIPLQVENRPGGAVLVGTGGASLDSSGEYRVTVNLPNNALNPRYAWVASEKASTLKRDDEVLTNPLVCRTGTGLSILAALAVLGVIGYVMTGGPSGTLYIVESLNPDNTVWGPWTLSGIPRVNRNTKSDLNKCGIKELRASRAEGIPDENGHKGRAVRIEAIDLNGKLFYDNVLEVGDVQPFVECGDIAYR